MGEGVLLTRLTDEETEAQLNRGAMISSRQSAVNR